MTQYIWLSFPLDLDGPRPPAIPPPELSDLYTVERDGAKVQILRVANHTGTHVDTPCHVMAGGLQITDWAPEELIFTRPVVIDLRLDDAEIVQPAHLEPHVEPLSKADIALFRFGYGEVRASDPIRFSSQCPGFGLESAHWLRNDCSNLRAIGMDVPSVATIAHLDETMRCHNVLLDGPGRRLLIIEEMNLVADLTRLREIRVNPWLVLGMDSGPCSVIGVLD